jgi:hypothetical protein
MNLRSDILADTDVAGMAYSITQVDCDTGAAVDPAVVITAQRDLEDILLPGGHPGFEDQPFDANSEHLFADNFQTLIEGCYDVTAQPTIAGGDISSDCAPASQSNVEVIDGQVTEIMLVSQCENDGVGALDAMVALNHAPQLTDVSYPDSKFTCTNLSTICVTAADPDLDPLRIALTGGEGVEVTPGLPVMLDGDLTQQCFDIAVPGPGQHDITIEVFDQAHTPRGLVDMSTLLGEGQTSQDTLSTPVHAMDGEACICDCPDGFELTADGSACEAYGEGEAVFNGNVLDVCNGDDRNEYGALGARFPGGLDLENEFFGNAFENDFGRLNAVGIWSCQETGRNEWIGFSTCINVEENGEYMLGTAGDDQSRIFVDGQPVFIQNGDQSFRRWWMTPVVLSAGPHVIELQGQDSGGVAATLGAEIYGPFPAGSTANDANMADLDYANNIIWSTGDQLGGTFDTGTNSGYSCPDGMSLNLCGEAPTCSSYQQVACQ